MQIEIKLILLGDSGVGKTSLARRFILEHFVPQTVATIGIDVFQTNVQYKGFDISVKLYDPAGQEKYRAYTKEFFRKADGIEILLKALKTFEWTKYFQQQILAKILSSYSQTNAIQRIKLYLSKKERVLLKA